MSLRVALLSAAVAMVAAPALAASVVVSVTGNSNPFLAGAAPGTACCGSDSAPGQSPTAAGIAFAPGSAMTFLVAGITDGAGTGPTGPDGAYIFDMANYGTGVAPAGQVGVLGLLGVFLNNTAPSGGAQPAGLSFSGGLNFASLNPGLNQIFWIGDGLTGTGTGASQVFTAPTGATRLFLGTVDGYDWINNSGAYSVSITYSPITGSAAPEPAAWAMMLSGFGLIGAAVRRRRCALAA